MAEMAGNFLRLTWPGFTVKWERHTEFTRYSIVQPLPQGVSLKQPRADLLSAMTVSPDWLSQVPGQTFMAMALAVVHGDLAQTAQIMSQAQAWLGARDLVQSQMGNGEQGHPHSWVLTDLQVNDSGFERLLVIADAGMSMSMSMSMSPTRAGRIVQRLLELETYRLMALRGLPVAKQLEPQLTQMENGLAEIAASLEHKTANDQQLLDTLVALAVQVEKSTAQHMYRFGATRAYEAIVLQRIAALRERPIAGTPTIGEFMQRRLSPAMGSMAAAAQRLASLSERVSRTSALLHTRVDIATEVQNQQLLEKLTRGQDLQLKLQTTVEGLSIAAISYYVVSLLLYAAKALKAAGVPIQPEMAVAAAVPLVLWGVWRMTRHIHAKITHPQG
jgi:uncharacterized membrane-anchored protein